MLMDKTDAVTDRQTDRWTEHKSAICNHMFIVGKNIRRFQNPEKIQTM